MIVPSPGGARWRHVAEKGTLKALLHDQFANLDVEFLYCRRLLGVFPQTEMECVV